jgi:hypothetical protein
MSAMVLIERPVERAQPAKRVQTVLRVSHGERYVGDILLDGDNRVWRRADTIPVDVVLKALVSYSRQGDVCGKLFSRSDGRVYLWHVVGVLAGAGSDGEL